MSPYGAPMAATATATTQSTDRRVVIVTGAASGIGRATAERLVGDGAAVVAVDADPPDQDAAGERRADVTAVVTGDVTEAATNERAVEVALARFGRLDAAVFNAGLSMSGDLLNLPMAQFDRAVDVNVRAVALGIRAVAGTMGAGGAGRIVVTASTSGLGGDPGMWAYNTTKGAVVNLVRAAAIELGPAGITVNAVCPGPTETAMTARIGALRRSTTTCDGGFRCNGGVGPTRSRP